MSVSQKTSILVPSQLPEFIREDANYSKFVSFIQAYYEWMEQQGSYLDASKNLLAYRDIDTTVDQFIDYFLNDFLPYFPQDALVDKKKAVKVARELYNSKGTPASYQFLFRLLYDSDFDIFYTKDVVLRASSGVWYVPKSLRLDTQNFNFLSIQGLRLFGETTSSIATVENAIISGTKIEVFVSNIERLFQSGEFVRVVDANNQDVLFNGQPLRAKIVGQISQIKIDPVNRGLLYQPGDPVVVYNGLSSNTGHGALAQVGTTTKGSIQRITVLNGGYGYTPDPYTQIIISNAPGATAIVGSVDPNPLNAANVNFIANTSIQSSIYTPIGNSRYSFLSSNITANANTSLANSLSFISFTTYPISSVIVTNGGGGITKVPDIYADSTFITDQPGLLGHVKNIGILAPIQIVNPGNGYRVNDVIVFTGGSGYGAHANVTNVSATGAITSISYVQGTTSYPLGGMGYKPSGLPSVSVLSANVQASNAVIYVPGILGDRASFSVVTDRAGSISTINVLDPGEDYIGAPNVSLRVQDIIVSNVSILNLPRAGDTVYQGANINVATYKATVNSISLLTQDVNPSVSKYNLRVFEYKTAPNPGLSLNIDKKLGNIHLQMANTAYPANYFFTGSPEYDITGVKAYGDGTARATASFLNGLVVGQGAYLNSTGQPSSYDVLQSQDYNNFTYEITVEKEIAKYRDTLLSLLHPSGTKVLGRYAMRSNNSLNFQGVEAVSQGHTLYYYTQRAAANATMTTDFTTKSTNIIQFNNLGTGVNIGTFIFANSSISLIPANGPNVHSEIVSINYNANSVTVASNTWLTFSNVATVRANSGSNTINILSLTGAYDIVNNGHYSNTKYHLMDVVYAGDQVLVANNTAKTVQSVDYINGIITLTSNLTANANSLMSVNRTFSAGGTLPNAYQVVIYGPIGTQYYPEITTENGYSLTTENGNTILLG